MTRDFNDNRPPAVLTDPPVIDLLAAYTARHETRWWIFHYTPKGHVVRLITSYPTKTAAAQAIAILGYTLIQPQFIEDAIRRPPTTITPPVMPTTLNPAQIMLAALRDVRHDMHDRGLTDTDESYAVVDHAIEAAEQGGVV